MKKFKINTQNSLKIYRNIMISRVKKIYISWIKIIRKLNNKLKIINLVMI